jgi:[acyl-carrier-protein] S-malonyltransferase
MRPAADAMEHALAQVEMRPPAVPLVANVLARPITDPVEISRRLVEQVTGMVRWGETVRWLTGEGGVGELVELGTGKVLSGLAKRIAPEATALALGTPAELDAYLAGLEC